MQRKEFEEIYSDVNLLAEVSLASTRILSSCRSRLIVRRAVIEAVLEHPLECLPVDSQIVSCSGLNVLMPGEFFDEGNVCSVIE